MRPYKAFTSFLDVLGFTQIIQSDEWVSRVTRITETLEEGVKKATYRSRQHNILPRTQLNHIMISDSVILWIECEDTPFENIKCLRYLIHCVQQIQYACALNNIWLRGGISFGDVLTERQNGNIFGMGYVSAYRLEQVAKFPRVIVGNEAIKAVFVPSEPSESILKKINIGFGYEGYNGDFLVEFKNKETSESTFVVDYLSPAFEFPEKQKIIHNLVQTNMMSSQLDIQEKFQWVKKYYDGRFPDD